MPAFGDEYKNAIVDAIRDFAKQNNHLALPYLVEEIMEAISTGIKYSMHDWLEP